MFHIERTIELADITIDNDSTLREFHKQIEAQVYSRVFTPGQESPA